MSALATRPAQAAVDMRPLGVAFGTLVLAIALLVSLTLSQRNSTADTAAAAPAPIAHDRGWVESTYSVGPALTINGFDTNLAVPQVSKNGFDKAHAPNAAQSRDLIVESANGGIRYTGIPYPTSGDAGSGGSNGTRFAR